MAPKNKESKEPEVLMQKSQSSCTIKKDSKGTVSFEVKVYSDNIEDAVKQAEKQYKKLDSNFGQED